MLAMAEDKVGASIHGLVESGQKEFKELYVVGEMVGSPGEIFEPVNE
jgi:hypothetical protein